VAQTSLDPGTLALGTIPPPDPQRAGPNWWMKNQIPATASPGMPGEPSWMQAMQRRAHSAFGGPTMPRYTPPQTGLPRGLNPFAVSRTRYGAGYAFPQAASQAFGQYQPPQSSQFDLLQFLGDFYQPTAPSSVQNGASTTTGANFIGSYAPPRRF